MIVELESDIGPNLKFNRNEQVPSQESLCSSWDFRFRYWVISLPQSTTFVRRQTTESVAR